ncbi:hypothetical protein DEU56DRAFT_985335 [Suillus clintonianus]|uniref:uncharacterized protein n=1 Tax=Suillus clintonianus TaxID=1904413 RepID=UPI001B865286|nr:uncharacterized protein DEU56DRAFT_985335 [Suillus clintonianus]KAG2111460.1 hypothetical protein DEU56DRAFT_985335 [Suillus clintonianus]
MASTGIPLDAGSILAVALEGVAYGFSVLMFIGTIWSLTFKQRMQDVSRPISVVAILLFILSTAHMVVTIIRVEDGLVKYRDTYPGGPVAFFADLTQPTMAIQHSLYLLQTLLADGVVIYRCYVVWQSVLIIVLPSMLWCSVAVTGVFVIYTFLQVTNNSTDLFANELGQPGQWVAAFFASTIATNLLSSGLLAYRIWMIERDISTVRATKDTMMPIVRVLVDAAVLYSVVLFTTLICFICSNNGEVVILDMIMPIISITFYMVLIRIAINRKNRDPSTIGPLQSLQIHISQITRNDSASVYGTRNEDQSSILAPDESGKASGSL